MPPLKKLDSIPISWFTKQGYCEYQLYLQEIKHVRMEPTPAMISGAERHDTLYSDFEKKAVPAEEPFKKLIPKIAQGKAQPLCTRELPVASKKYRIHGRIDEVEVSKDEAVIVENKPSHYLQFWTKLQLWAYCLAFKEYFGWKKNLRYEVRGTETDKKYSEILASPQESKIIENISYLHDCFSGKKPFRPPVNHPERCTNCELRGYCDKCLQ